jgi:hypothetical protein
VPTTRAQEVGEPASFRPTIEEALSEYEAGNYPEASALFAKAHALYPSARTLRGLAVCAFELRTYAKSIGYLESALASTIRPLEGAMRADLERLLARAYNFVATVKLEVEPAVARVSVDGAPYVPVGEVSQRLDIGRHELTFKAAGFVDERHPYTVESAGALELSVHLRPLAPASTSAARPEAGAPTPARRRMPWGLGGSALALGVGCFAAASSLSLHKQDLAEKFVNTFTRSDRYVEAQAEWRSARVPPYVVAAAGSAVLTLGALTVLLSAEGGRAPRWIGWVSGAAGVGLASWGLYDIVQGGPCTSPDERTCAMAQGQLDRGALVMLGALPPLTFAITSLLGAALAPDRDGTARWTVHPLVMQQGSGLQAKVRWF